MHRNRPELAGIDQCYERIAGYAVDLVIAQLNNVLNTEYSTAAQLGPTGITPSGTFIARPFPAVNGEYPLYRSTFVAPGAPFRAWGGIRLHF